MKFKVFSEKIIEYEFFLYAENEEEARKKAMIYLDDGDHISSVCDEYVNKISAEE